jgi:hypothetical protein
MRRVTAVAALALASGTAASPALSEAPSPVAINITADFTAFWDATKTLTMDERVAAFHRDMDPKFPGFYDPARFAKPGDPDRQDKRIAAAITAFPKIRERYEAKVEAFDADLAKNTATFVKAFPDYVPTVPVALVHSLGEMDGGTRVLKSADGSEKEWLVFGADVMAEVHDFPDESAFFHHELFHTYHLQHGADRQCEIVICGLWQEGLAVYVASVLHPDATPAELLLNKPADLVSTVDAKRKEAFAQLLSVLDSGDEKVGGALFSFDDDGTGLPRRRAYYLGFLVAQEIGKGRTLVELAHMPMSEADPLIRAEVARQAR